MSILPESPFANTLESLIDRHGIRAVVKAAVDICHGKAEHVRTNWPEEKELAKLWDEAGDKLERARFFLPRLP